MIALVECIPILYSGSHNALCATASQIACGLGISAILGALSFMANTLEEGLDVRECIKKRRYLGNVALHSAIWRVVMMVGVQKPKPHNRLSTAYRLIDLKV